MESKVGMEDPEKLTLELERMKDKQIIDLLHVAISDLAHYQSAQPVIQNLIAVTDGVTIEYIHKYPEQEDFNMKKELKPKKDALRRKQRDGEEEEEDEG